MSCEPFHNKASKFGSPQLTIRGEFEVDLSWKDGKLSRATLHAAHVGKRPERRKAHPASPIFRRGRLRAGARTG
jgi:hypothetical protein